MIGKEHDDWALTDADVTTGEGSGGKWTEEEGEGDPEEEGFQGFGLEEEKGEKEENGGDRNCDEEEWLTGFLVAL